MKILIVQESDWLKRGPHQQHQLADRLSLKGHQIRVIDYEILWREQGKSELCSRHQVFEDVWKINPSAKVTVIRPGIIKIPLLDYVSIVFTHQREINRQIEEFKPDVIIGFSILNSYLAVKAARSNDIPFIYYWIDVLHRLIPFKPLQFIGEILEHKILRQADRMLTINDKLKEYVINAGAAANKTHVIRAGIDVEQFKPSVSIGNLRKQYGLKETDTVLFFMGWLYHFSGLKEVAQKLAKETNKNLKLLIVGEGDAFRDLKQIAEKYNLQDRIILTGQRLYIEMPSFIAASDICLLPAYPWEKTMHDIVPIKLYEYMAMKKPVIATRLPGVMKEFGKSNGVVYVNKPEDVINKAKSLVKDGKIGELGDKARKFVQKYSWDSITDKFEKILEEVVRSSKFNVKH
ncbi:MAG: glycosyltransferase family 4 protein [Dehalococcoidia bacterium]|nr:glycosyltransferase family 4 protein [Dehalococcoidia bacterium]